MTNILTHTNDEAASSTKATKPRSRGANIALWTLQVLLAAAFAFAGLNKIFGMQQEMIDNFNKLAGPWFRYFVGVLELAGAIGLVIPRVSGLAALWLAGVMGGAVITHLTVQPPMYFASVPAVLALIFCLIARARWTEAKSLIGLQK